MRDEEVCFGFMATFRSRSRTVRSVSRRPGSPLPRAEPRPFFSAIENLNRGNVPNNEQLKQWFQYLGRSLTVPTGQLSPSGKGLVRDLSELVRLLGVFIDEKNSDELIQRFITHARLASKLALQGLSRSGRITLVKEPRRQVYLLGSKDVEVQESVRKMRKEALKEVRALYRLIQLMIASPDVRNSVSQIQDMARRILQTNIAKPSEPRVSFKPGQKEQRKTFVKKEGYETERKAGYGDEDLDRRIENLRRDIRGTAEDIQEISSAGYVPYSSGSFVNIETQTKESGEWIYKSKGVEEEQVKETLGIRRLATEELKIPELGTEAERLPIFSTEEEEHEVRKLKEAKEEPLYSGEQEVSTVEQSPSSGMSEAEKKRIIEQMRQLFKGISANKELQKSVYEALKYVTTLQTLGVEAVREPTGPIPSELQYEENIKAAQKDLLRLAERFAGGASLQPLLDIVGSLRTSMVTDYELKDFLGDWRSFIRNCLKDAAYLDSEEYKHRAEFLVDRSGTIARDKYSQQFNEANNVLNQFMSGWREDRLTSQIGAVLQRIIREDMLGGGGTQESAQGLFLFSIMKPDLLHDFRHVILPSLLSNLHEIPLPRIESISDGDRLVLENVVIPAGGFMPIDLNVKQSSALRMNPREKLLGRYSGSPREKTIRARSGWHNSMHIHMYQLVTFVDSYRIGRE